VGRVACVLALSAALVACDSSASLFGPGLDLKLRVNEGQLQRGVLGGDGGGPAVTQVQRPQPQVVRGQGTVMMSGRLGPGGVALHIHAEGDDNHWVIPAKGFDFVVADELQWSAQLQFSHAIQSDTLRVFLQAADKDGRLGPVTETSFSVLSDVPPARLLVSLGWDAPVDLDLHVMLPDGTVVGSKNPNSYEPPAPGQPLPPPDEWMEGGWLDFDSNQQCELDLRNTENVMWLNADPPPGRYKVFAHLFSACGHASVNFVSVVQHNGDVVERGASTLYEFDARVHPDDDDAPGLLLLEFDIP